MAYNGAGTFLINSAGQPVVAGTTISETVFNALTADLAAGLSTAITKNGQTTPTANIPMGGFKLTGLGTGVANTDAANVGQVTPALITATGATTARSAAAHFADTISFKDFGAVGDGVTDDTAAVQAALTAGGRFYLGASRYLISSALSTAAKVELIGVQGGLGIYDYTGSITSGFVAAVPNLNLLTLTGSNSSITGVGFQMAGNGANTSGAALTLGVATEISVSRCHFNQPYVGIDATGVGLTQNIASNISECVFIAPVLAGIRLGVNSYSGNTVDTRITDNNFIAFASNTASGVLMLEAGGVFFRGNSAYNMGYGLKIFPGSNQYVTGYFYDVLGDTSYVNDLFIDSNGGQYSDLVFTNTWAASCISGTSVFIGATAGVGYAGSVTFVNHKTILNNTAPGNFGMDIQGGDVLISDSRVGSKFAAYGSTAIRIGALVKSVSITGLRSFSMLAPSGGTYGVVGVGISAPAATVFRVQGNDLSGATVPLSYTPTAGGSDTVIISDNIGIDNIAVNVASASTITLPHNSVIYLTGTTTINVMNGRWANRVVRVVAIAGLTLAAGPGGVATTTVLAVGQAATLTWGVSLNGWVVG